MNITRRDELRIDCCETGVVTGRRCLSEIEQQKNGVLVVRRGVQSSYRCDYCYQRASLLFARTESGERCMAGVAELARVLRSTASREAR
jgi:hypothetical protein